MIVVGAAWRRRALFDGLRDFVELRLDLLIFKADDVAVIEPAGAEGAEWCGCGDNDVGVLCFQQGTEVAEVNPVGFLALGGDEFFTFLRQL